MSERADDGTHDEEGDVLYLPRGWWHHVIPLNVGSFHISVGCYLPTMFDYIVQTAGRCLEQHAPSRRAFSPDQHAEAVRDALDKLAEALLEPANARGFDQDWSDREHMHAEFNLASLEPDAEALADGLRLALATFRGSGPVGGLLPVNGGRLQLEPVSEAVVAVLAKHNGLELGSLCAALPAISPDEVRSAVLDLARHDVISIQR